MHYDTIQICNEGNKTLSIVNISLTGISGWHIYSLCGDGTKGFMTEIEPGMCCELVTMFDSHEGEGEHSGEIIITSEGDNYNHEVIIDVTYLVTGADITVTPADFSECLVIGTQVMKTMTIKNEGDDVLEFVISEVDWSESAFFVLWLSQDPNGGVLNPGESMDITLTFDATAAMQLIPCATYKIKLRIQTNDQDAYVMYIPVVMEVGEPDLYLSATSLDFGPFQPCNDEGDCDSFYVQNEGCGCEDLKFTVTEDPEVDWLTIEYPTGEVTLAQFQDQYIKVCTEADELAAGVYTTDLLIESNDPDGDARVTVSMTVHAAWVDADPKSFHVPVSYGKIRDTMLIVCNTGDKPTDWGIQLDTPVPWLQFEPTSGHLEAAADPAEPVCDTIYLHFNAKDSGVEPGFNAKRYLVFDAYDDHCSPKDLIPVEITVYAADIVVIPTDCFNIHLGVEESMDTTLVICNNGLAELNIHSITHGSCNWLDVATLDTALFKGECLDHNVHIYTGQLAPCTTYTDTISIESNDPDENPYKVCVNLTVEAPLIALTETALADTLVFGEKACDVTFGIVNTGCVMALDWLITESPYVSWLSENPITGTTAPGDTSFVTVCFDGAELPVADSPASTYIVVTSNDPTNPSEMIEVTFVTTSAKVAVHPGNVEVGLNVGDFMDKVFTIQNPTEDILNWTLACKDNAAWLTYPKAGSVNPYESEIVNVHVDATNLSNGTHSTTLELAAGETTIDIPVKVLISVRGVEEEGLPEIGDCDVVYLSHNLPNPFATKTSFVYGVPGRTTVMMKVYDCTGKEVKTLVDGTVDSGYYKVSWDGTDNNGSKLVSGIYFYRLAADGTSITKKLILLR
jgi:hypothetical protein